MFKRPHHQRIAQVLAALDADLLQQTQCYFAGGTAIVLLLDEYRESLDIDFLCASQDGYRLLRNLVGDDLGPLLRTPVTQSTLSRNASSSISGRSAGSFCPSPSSVPIQSPRAA